MYIELKTGYTDDGPAWIGYVEFSKTKRTAYFNGKAFKHAGKGYYGDVETKENYWISGVKKNGEDRHRFGKGKIMIDKTIVDEYLSLVDFDELKSNKFELVEIEKTDIQKFNKLVNEKITPGYDYYSLKEKEIHKLSEDELVFLIDYCSEKEKNSAFNKARRSIKKYRIELEAEMERRKK
jgi:hypothetical protein